MAIGLWAACLRCWAPLLRRHLQARDPYWLVTAAQPKPWGTVGAVSAFCLSRPECSAVFWLLMFGGFANCFEFGRPVVGIGTNCCCLDAVDGQVVVAQAVDGGEHACKDLPVETGVIRGRPVEKLLAAVALREGRRQ